MLQHLRMRRTEQAWGEARGLTWQRSDLTLQPRAFPARSRAGSRTAARRRTRSAYGCGERNKPGGETHGLTWRRGSGWERPRAENQPNNILARRSDRWRPSPPPVKAPTTVHATPKALRHLQLQN
ncbi:hypothetical protein NDU88_007513 [Pleurodeles waltl]|uniref:Uncharacterized protein n=1 Tax=Pleurodeles waltl TaxID=8319 RepID=A0AAV7NWV2_PLEWA|nr:hypothetical protein NDU88_007513 [Pleurodeles waltl]